MITDFAAPAERDPSRLVSSCKFTGAERPQHLAQLRCMPRTEGRFKSRLGRGPSLVRRLQALLTRLCQVEFLGAPVGRRRFDPDQAIPLQRQDVAPEGRTIHDHVPGERFDSQRSEPLEPRENRVLGRAQAARRQELIVKLRDVPSRRWNGETVAFLGSWWDCGRHRQILATAKPRILQIGGYALMSTRFMGVDRRAYALMCCLDLQSFIPVDQIIAVHS